MDGYRRVPARAGYDKAHLVMATFFESCGEENGGDVEMLKSRCVCGSCNHALICTCTYTQIGAILDSR